MAVRDNTKTGNSVKQISSALHIRGCAHLPLQQVFKIIRCLKILHFICFTEIYICQGFIASNACTNNFPKDAPEGLQYPDKNIHIHITWNQCNHVEGMEREEASLCLKSPRNCAVFEIWKAL